MYNNLMVDIETLSVASNAEILSVAAVPFNFSSDSACGVLNMDECFYKIVNIEHTENIHRRDIAASTVKWWMKQSKEARSIFKASGESLPKILLELEYFINSFMVDKYSIYAKGPGFDLVILKNAYSQYGMQIPWKYYQERCVRTIEEMGKLFNVPARIKTEKSIAHDALDDSYEQVKSCIHVFNYINKNVHSNSEKPSKRRIFHY